MNAMIALDSVGVNEQVVIDVLVSAFDSALVSAARPARKLPAGRGRRSHSNHAG
ncbi:hypothetical protein MJ579_10910 [Klebsiella pneumoniae]|nr:hypothetical protein MJ579_10910 [Klebsiella pneumoniae]